MCFRFLSLLAVAFFLAPPLFATPRTALTLVQESSGNLLAGPSEFYDSTTGSFDASAFQRNLVIVNYGGNGRFLRLRFQAPGSSELLPGVYENATSDFTDNANPKFVIDGIPSAGITTVSRFTIKEIVFGTGNAITSFRATFAFQAIGSYPSAYGEIWYNSEAPVPLAAQVFELPAGGAAFRFAIPAGADATDFEATGLPNGVALSRETGELSGSLPVAGSYLLDFTASVGGKPAGGLVALAVQPKSSAFSLKMSSPPGEYVGAGLKYNYTTADGEFFAEANFDNGVSIRYFGFAPSNDFWFLDFAAPFSAPLRIGEYLGATRYPFQDPENPGLDVSGNGRGYNMSSGKFRILEAEINVVKKVVSFVATFEQVGDGGSRPMVGTIRYNARADFTSTGSVRGNRGEAFSLALSANNFPTTFSSTTLPAGLSLDPVTGVISGTPLVPGEYLVEITATGLTSVAISTLEIVIGPLRPRIVGVTTASGVAGVPFFHALDVLNEPTSFSATGLPAGLAISQSGIISGLPTRGGAFQVLVTAANDSGSSTTLLTLFIARQDLILHNVSTRARVQNDLGVLIGGFVLEGPVSKRVMLRAPGPSLASALPAGVAALADPTLELRNANGELVAANDDWKSNPADLVREIAASGFVPANDKEPALVQTLAPGSYTVIVRGKNGGTGIGLVELFDLDPDASRIVNLSTRGKVEGDSGVMIAGFVVSGNNPVQMVVRAVGPSLSNAGLPANTILADPTLEIFDSAGQSLGSSDDWRQQVNAANLAATNFAPANDLEPALLLKLPPGAYTAVVRGKNGGTGIGLVEVFRLPQ